MSDSDEANAAIEAESAPTDSDDSKKSQADRMVDLARGSGAEVFHTPDGSSFVSAAIGGFRQTFRLDGLMAMGWLRLLFYEETGGGAPGNQAVATAIATLSAQARFSGPEQEVYLRFARVGDEAYLDLGDALGRAVRISPRGWEVIGTPMVRFRRTSTMRPLPVPATAIDVESLTRFFNAPGHVETRLLCTALAVALAGVGPYPIVVLNGEQGSAKSTLIKELRLLIDPADPATRSPSLNERDLIVACENNAVVAFDNLSSITPAMSDSFCRLSTGGGFGTRRLYTNDEEFTFSGMRPLFLNGIDELTTRADLLDRAMTVNLPAIPSSERRDEHDLWKEFDLLRPGVLAMLLDAAVLILRDSGSVRLTNLPRMADFARAGAAAAPAFGWTADEFVAAYAGLAASANAFMLDVESIAAPLIDLVAQGPWEGTASELLQCLGPRTPEHQRDARSWPKSASVFTNRLHRIVPALRTSGVLVEFIRTGSKRLIKVNMEHGEVIDVAPSSASSPSSGAPAADPPRAATPEEQEPVISSTGGTETTTSDDGDDGVQTTFRDALVDQPGGGA